MTTPKRKAVPPRRQARVVPPPRQRRQGEEVAPPVQYVVPPPEQVSSPPVVQLAPTYLAQPGQHWGYVMPHTPTHYRLVQVPLANLMSWGGMLPPGTVPLQVVSHTPSQVQGVLQQGLQTLTGCMYPPQAAPVPPPPEPPPPQTEAECDPPGVYDYAPDPDPVEHVPCAKLAPRTVNAPIIVPPPNRKRKMHDADADAEDDGGPGPVGADSESSYEWVEVDDDDEPEWTGGRRPQQPPWAPPLHMKLRQNVQRQLKRLKPHSWQKPGFEFKD